MLSERLGQGEGFPSCTQVCASVGDRFLNASQPYQHCHIRLSLSFRLSQIEIFLPAPAPFQDMQPRLSEVITIKRSFAFPAPDRKTTRLNSSHQLISYPSFCLK